MQNGSGHPNDTRTVEQWNQELVVKYLPLTSILILYLIVGVCGNCVVIFIYLKRFKTYCAGRFYIPVLAAVDAVSVVANCLFHVAETLLPVKYESYIGCKIAWFLATIVTLDGTYILVLVAVNRYVMICRPLEAQLSSKWKRVSIFIATVLAVIMSAPCLYFSGTVEVTSKDGIIGDACALFTSGIPYEIALVFSLALLVMIVAELVLMSILYFRICRVVKHIGAERLKSRKENQTATACISSVDISVIESTDDKLENHPGRGKENDLSTQMGTSRETEGTERPPKQLFEKKRRVRVSQITTINIVVTIAFAVSFFPKLALFILESTNSGFLVTDPNKGVLIMFLHSAYILNNIVNPFIYSFMDTKFKLELRKLFC